MLRQDRLRGEDHAAGSRNDGDTVGVHEIGLDLLIGEHDRPPESGEVLDVLETQGRSGPGGSGAEGGVALVDGAAVAPGELQRDGARAGQALEEIGGEEPEVAPSV